MSLISVVGGRGVAHLGVRIEDRSSPCLAGIWIQQDAEQENQETLTYERKSITSKQRATIFQNDICQNDICQRLNQSFQIEEFIKQLSFKIV